MEVLKTRLQLQGELVARKSANHQVKTYDGVLKGLRRIAQVEGAYMHRINHSYQ
jgi:hypothetical protein